MASVSEGGDTWRKLKVPDQRHGWQDHHWHHEWCYFTPRKVSWKFHDDISIRSVSGEGGWSTLRTLWGPDQRHGWQDDFWHHVWCYFTQRKVSWKFHDDIYIGVVWGGKGVLWGHWMFLTRDMDDGSIIDIMDDVVLCEEGGGSGRGLLGGHWGFMTRDMEDMVVLDIINDVF